MAETFDLEVGDSITHDWSVTTETSVLGFGQTFESDVSHETTYIGQESVTVIAGTYDTCRIEFTEVNDSEWPRVKCLAIRSFVRPARENTLRE